MKNKNKNSTRGAGYNAVNTPRVIGLTGMSGAGKSKASEIFKKRGFFVINCDEFAHDVISKPECANEIKQHFPVFFDENGFNRKIAAKNLFSDRKKLRLYESVVYPRIIHELTKLIDTINDKDIVLDAPTLYKSGADKLCDIVIAVIADALVCIDRITKRDGLTAKDAANRQNNQPSADFFYAKADYVITNDSLLEGFFEEKVNTIIDEIIQTQNAFRKLK